MPVINTSIELYDTTTDTYFSLEQNKNGIFVYCKDTMFSEYGAEANLFISKNELDSFIKSLQNLASNY